MFAVVGQQAGKYWVFDTKSCSLELVSETCLQKLSFVAGVSDNITVLSYKQVITAQLTELTIACGYSIQLYNLCALKDWGIIKKQEYEMIVRWMQQVYHNTMDEYDMWIMVSPLSKDVVLQSFKSPAGLVAWVDVHIAKISNSVSVVVRENLQSVYIPDNTLFFVNTPLFYDFRQLHCVRLPEYTFSLSELKSSDTTTNTSAFNSLLWLYREMFKYTALKYIELPEQYETIDESVFSDCAALEKVVCKAPVVNVGGLAFKKCLSLKDVEFAGVVNLNYYAIQYNEGMRVKYYAQYDTEDLCIIRSSSFICQYSKAPSCDLSAVLPQRKFVLCGRPISSSAIEKGYYDTHTKCVSMQYNYFNDLVHQLVTGFGVYPIYSGAVKLSLIFTDLSVSLISYSMNLGKVLDTFDKMANDLSTEFKYGLGFVECVEIPEDFLTCDFYVKRKYKNFCVVYK